MIAQAHSFVHMLFISIIALFPVVNPFGSALIVSPYLSQLSEPDKKASVKKITIYAFFICIVFLLGGQWILELFGISVPVIQLAGGIMICKMGWDSLSAGTDNPTEKDDVKDYSKTNSGENIKDRLFYPLTFPITTGAGTISVLFTLSAHSSSTNWISYSVNTMAVLTAIVVMCILVYIFYGNTKIIINKLGSNGQVIANRIIAFLIFCVGLQIAVTGIKSLFPIATTLKGIVN